MLQAVVHLSHVMKNTWSNVSESSLGRHQLESASAAVAVGGRSRWGSVTADTVSSVQWADVTPCCLEVVPDLLGAWLDCGCCAQQS